MMLPAKQSTSLTMVTKTSQPHEGPAARRQQLRLTASAATPTKQQKRPRDALPGSKSAAAGFSRRRRPPRSSTSSSVETIIQESTSVSSEKSDEMPSEPKPAWECFSSHIATVNDAVSQGPGGITRFGGEKRDYVDRCSDMHRRIVKDMKDIAMRKKARELLMKAKLESLKNSAEATNAEPPSEDTDSEEDEEEYERQRRKADAQRYWAMIRNNVQEKIRLRKLERGPAGGTWNAMRAQLRTLIRGDSVRRDLYEKYGIIPEPGKRIPVDTMRPHLSSGISDIIRRFDSIQVRKLSFSAPPNRLHQRQPPLLRTQE